MCIVSLLLVQTQQQQLPLQLQLQLQLHQQNIKSLIPDKNTLRKLNMILLNLIWIIYVILLNQD